MKAAGADSGIGYLVTAQAVTAHDLDLSLTWLMGERRQPMGRYRSLIVPMTALAKAQRCSLHRKVYYDIETDFPIHEGISGRGKNVLQDFACRLFPRLQSRQRIVRAP